MRVSHDVRANFNQFYFSQLSLEIVLFRSHVCRIVQIAETSLRCVCEGLVTGLRRVRDICDDLATSFAIIFVAQKSITCLKLWRTVRNEFAMHARTLRCHENVSRQFATVWRIDSQTHRKLVTSQ